MMEFPKDFFWGAATSAYQVEGNNVNCDWWEWETKMQLAQRSQEACRHYQLYAEDFNLAKALNHNCHRLSIEWSRVQPQENQFSSFQIEHYRQVIDYLRKLDIEPVVTLHHFTNPSWFAKQGGWLNKNAPEYFLGYVKKIVEALGEKVRFWVTINEPMVYVYHAYLLGAWPPQEKSFCQAYQVKENLIISHLEAYKLIHDIYQQNNLHPPSVSIAKNMQAFVACRNNFRDKFAVYLRNKLFNFDFLTRLIRKRALDFIGINYYTRSLVETRGWGLSNLLLDVCQKSHSQLEKNFLGWDIYPQGLYALLLQLKKFNLPVFILENGVCTTDDNLRSEFIYEHLKNIYLAIEKGVKVTGYIYWSLIDNYEWDKGLNPRFGLIEVDYQTYKRSIRESARRLARVCKTGNLEAWNY